MSLKDFYKILYKSKLYILIFIISFVIFFIIYFPGDIVINYTLNKVNSNKFLTFTPTSTSLTLIPNLGFSFKGARITLNDGTSILVPKGEIGAGLFSLITFSPSVYAKFFAFRGNFDMSIDGLSYFSMPDELKLNLDINDVLTNKTINEILGFNFRMIINGNIQGYLNLMNISYSDLKFDLILDKIIVDNNIIMGFEIPKIAISKGIIKGNYGKGDVSFDDLSLGSSSDDLMLSVRGKIKTKYQKPYDLIIKLKLSGELDKQYGSLLKMGPIAQYQNAEGVYSFKMKGDMRNPIPQFEGL